MKITIEVDGRGEDWSATKGRFEEVAQVVERVAPLRRVTVLPDEERIVGRFGPKLAQ